MNRPPTEDIQSEIIVTQAAKDISLPIRETDASTHSIPQIHNLDQLKPYLPFVETVPIQYARKHGVLICAENDDELIAVISDLSKLHIVDILSRWLKIAPKIAQAPHQKIISAINTAYEQQHDQVNKVVNRYGVSTDEVEDLNQYEHNTDKQAILNQIQKLEAREDLLDVDQRAPMIQLANMLLFEAVRQQSSDVHIQPYEHQLVIRYRIDGVLFDAFTLPKSIQEELISRIKVMGKMNIAEKRLPQDGRATVMIGDRVIDLRLSSVPTSHGERIVIRLLDKSARLYTLGELGMNDNTLMLVKQLIANEHGLVLVTGPTGSGKSTTLYASLQEINSLERNIITLEDPIEYQLDGISQIQISTKKGMTFASGLRSVLRQDPDIIMVGEIRDRETAEMAIQSALTGHLVFSTLHTNDAASAVTRLLDLGIEPYLVSSSLIGVLAQRLVRRICPDCKAPLESDNETYQSIVNATDHSDIPDISSMYHGMGCEVCRQTGYRGRVGIFELLSANDPVRQLIQQRSTASDIKSTAVQHGMTTLQQDGFRKISLGQTTLDEVVRVTTRVAV